LLSLLLQPLLFNLHPGDPLGSSFRALAFCLEKDPIRL
jgi:hypothetical protein